MCCSFDFDFQMFFKYSSDIYYVMKNKQNSTVRFEKVSFIQTAFFIQNMDY